MASLSTPETTHLPPDPPAGAPDGPQTSLFLTRTPTPRSRLPYSAPTPARNPAAAPPQRPYAGHPPEVIADSSHPFLWLMDLTGSIIDHSLQAS